MLVALYQHAGLEKPSGYVHDVASWAQTIEMIAELRNLIVHGAAMVNTRLGQLSNRPNSMTFDFSEGTALDVKLHHLQSVECFCDQLLSAINISLVEKAFGPIKKAGA